jgi:Protein of unknown function (DUF3311)
MEEERVPGESPVYREPPRGPADEAPVSRRPNQWAVWLLLIPFVALLYPPWYDNIDPTLGGIPFFIWYQFLWVILGAAIIAFVYKVRG